MKNLLKLIAILVLVALLCVSVVACKSGGTEVDPTEDTTTTQEEVTTKKPIKPTVTTEEPTTEEPTTEKPEADTSPISVGTDTDSYNPAVDMH